MKYRMGVDSRKGDHALCVCTDTEDCEVEIVYIYSCTNKKDFLKQLKRVMKKYKIDKIIKEI